MTNHALLTLHGVSYQLPDGSFLFDDLHEQFDGRPTGLVGRNGVGKTVLARILAGELAPTRGRCERHGRVRYLAQRIAARPGETVADLAGVRDVITALRRIEAGSTRPEDFDTLAERWDIEPRLRDALAANGLAHLHADTPATTLSGGEATQIALLGALLSDADLLIVDEPSNHLDREHRQALREQLRRWPRGLIVVSHDRELLADMQRIVELSAHGLRSYGGGYAFYAEARADEQARAQHELAHHKAERRREERELSAQRERLERRQSRGAKQAAEANQAPILLGLQKSRAENSGGRLRQQQEAAREAASRRVRDAAARVDDELPVVLFAPDGAAAAQRKAAELRGITLPHLRGAQAPLDLQIGGMQRVALTGANGSGKSTLLKVLAGQLPPASGRCERYVETVYLDQQMAVLNEGQALLTQLLTANRGIAESELRARLALLGLTAEKIMQPPSSLSGGERLKAALARALYSERPAQLLLLDEPDNHLDLASLQALEAMLRQYRGALVVVSHDAAFLAALELDHGLERTPRGWALTPWPAPA